MGHRFMYENLLDEAVALTATSVARGFVGAGVPRVANAGGAVIFSGAYTGEDHEVYTVEIDAVGDADTARFKWRKTSTPGGGWEASGIPAAQEQTALDAGVAVRFVNGAEAPSFALGDRWQATAHRAHAPGRIRDLDPATSVRSASPPEDAWALAFDLGAAKSPGALIVHRHNFTESARIRTQANDSPEWSAPALDEPLSWQSGTLVHYLDAASRAYRHWRLLVEGDAANPAGHLEAAEVYLGPYFEPADHFWLGNVVGEEAVEEPSRTENGVERPILLNRGRTATLPYARVSAAQCEAFLDMYRAVKDVASGRAKPLFVHLDVDDPASIVLADLASGFSPRHAGPDDFSFTLDLKERRA